jgi:predicted TIM-barrel fold metal-dependent hydrolase
MSIHQRHPGLWELGNFPSIEITGPMRYGSDLTLQERYLEMNVMDRRKFLKGSLAAMSAMTLKPEALLAVAEAKPNAASQAADKIDFYCHFSSMKVIDYLEEAGESKPHVFRSLFFNTPTLIDVDKRLRLMDSCGISRSVLVPLPWIETSPAVYADPQKCSRAARIMNEELARITAKRPDRFSAVALLPATNTDIMIREIDYAVKQLGFGGGMVAFGPTVKRPDHGDYEQLWATAVRLDVPIWMHPSRPPVYPDYIDEEVSKYQVWQTLSWLMDSSTAMVRIVFAGVFDRYPGLKLVVHHHGALVPLFAKRMQYGWDYFEESTGKKQVTSISRPYIDHFRKFYCDTATQGHEPALLEIAYRFFGKDRILFGSDAPMDAAGGKAFTLDAMSSVEAMAIPVEDKQLIYRDNALKILKLNV